MQRTAARTGVGFIPDPEASQRPEMREIIFFDTPDFRLYNNAFILRRRVTYVDGFPAGDPEIVFKYRHPDEKAATAVDVRPKIAGKHRIKFKAEALPLKDQVGGYRLLYSHNAQFGLSQMHDADKLSMDTLLKALPALKVLKTTAGERLGLVNGGIVEEVLLPLGRTRLRQGPGRQVRHLAVAHARRAPAAGRRVRVPGQVPEPRLGGRPSRRSWRRSSTSRCSRT